MEMHIPLNYKQLHVGDATESDPSGKFLDVSGKKYYRAFEYLY